MKISTSTVSYEGYHEASGNADRLKIMEESIKELKNKKVELATYPGGYFFENDIESIKTIGSKVQALSDKYKIFIAVGIDILKKEVTKKNIQTSSHSLPFFTIAVSPNGENTKIWRQRSITSQKISNSIDKIYKENRVLTIGSKNISILSCGEIFNSNITSHIISSKVDIAIDLAHVSQGFRVWSAMKNLAMNNIKSFCSVHAQKNGAMKYCYIPDGKNRIKKMSSRSVDIKLVDVQKIEIKIWRV